MKRKSFFVFVPNKMIALLLITGVLVLSLAVSFKKSKLVFEEVAMEQYMIDGELVPITFDENKIIKWLSFDVPLKIMQQALNYDIDSHNQPVQLNWIELISYEAVKTYGKFTKDKRSPNIDEIVKRVKCGEDFNTIVRDMKMYNYYFERYKAVLGEFVGEYKNNYNTVNYGLKVFSPIAKGYFYSHYDDFGNVRSYGYKRVHLGNDLFGNVGTPVIAIEGGFVEALGWNKYGGWRVGIRSHDKKRYYYYAHLRKDHPFHKTLVQGANVNAGDVIGYVGKTGYSTQENINNISVSHLHLGMQIIFDECQKDGNDEIWINIYNIVKLLSKNRAKVIKNTISKDYDTLR